VAKVTTKKVLNLKVLSFDLDNALYDNTPVLANAEECASNYLKQQFNIQNKHFDINDFFQIRNQLLATKSIQYEDVSLLRRTALNLYCKQLKGSSSITRKAFELFIHARSKADILPPISTMLQHLSKHFTLVSATNGNCDINQLSINRYFSQNYSASNGYRAKPHPQMLLKVADEFEVEPQQIMHIGDSLEKDGGAAKAARTKFFHFDPFSPSANLQLCCNELTESLIGD
jgi:FMN hydrolase / 5-amino-6-(5-phospho-D-ribitylamino)uracil phosphatase